VNGYVAFYGGSRTEVHADTSYEAWRKAVEHFGVRKSRQHLVVVFLAEKNGEQVYHVADF
jgi:hypothetical protein